MNGEKFSQIINNLKVKPGGTLRFYGEWFGRPYDNFHKIAECSFNHDILIIKFDAGEQIKIFNPNKTIINDKELIIKESSCVEFTRYDSGKPKTDENLIIVRYSIRETENPSNKGDNVYNKLINRNYPAVELLSI